MSASSTWSWISSIWIAPPSGFRFIRAVTTTSVSCAVNSRTRADAALWPPLTARKALVTAMAIFDGSKPTTAPLRRITLYCDSRGSVFASKGVFGSPAMTLRGVAEEGEGVGLATCIDRSPGEILWFLLATARSACIAQFRPGADFEGGRNGWTCTLPRALRGDLGIFLRNQNLLYLVFKCRINTNHSSSWSTMQVLFDAQKGGPKSFGKSVK